MRREGHLYVQSIRLQPVAGAMASVPQPAPHGQAGVTTARYRIPFPCLHCSVDAFSGTAKARQRHGKAYGVNLVAFNPGCREQSPGENSKMQIDQAPPQTTELTIPGVVPGH